MTTATTQQGSQHVRSREIFVYTWSLVAGWTLLVIASVLYNHYLHHRVIWPGEAASLAPMGIPLTTAGHSLQEYAFYSILWGLGLILLGLTSRKLASSASALHTSEGRLHEQALRLEEEIAVRQQSEEALLYSTELIQSTIASMEELVFVLDREGILTRFFQPDRPEAQIHLAQGGIGSHYRNAGLPAPLLERLDSAIARLIENGAVQTFDFHLALSKTTRWYTATVSLRRDRTGSFAGTTVVCRDITDRKQAEMALAESEQRFAVFMRHLPLAVFIKDQTGRICYANEYLEDLLGVETLMGKTIEEIFPDETAAKMIADDRQALTDGLTLVHDPIRDMHGDDRTFETYKFPISMPGGTTLLGCISMDVTERLRFSDSLALKQQQLQELNDSLEQRVTQAVDELRQKDELLIQQGRFAAMGEMINNIAHQWRQPLNNLGLLVQNLQLTQEAGELTSASLRTVVSQAMDVIMFMSRTIDDFRNFFREDKNSTTIQVNAIVRTSLDFVAAMLKSSNIGWNLSGESNLTAQGYPNEFSQVLLNILNNARDILLERNVVNPFIAVNLFREADKVVVSVADNGGGIPEEILPRIFDPYFTTKDRGQGTGIGLYMSKVIIEKHMNGRLTARNTDCGAEFRIEI